MYSRPALATLIARITSDIEARLPGAEARLRRSNLAVLARVLSGATHGLYGYINWVSLQVLPDSAETTILERWAAIWGLTRIPAGFASGTVLLTGTDDSPIAAGTSLQRADGYTYLTTAPATIASGVAAVPISAAVSGSASTLASGNTLTLVTSVAGVSSTATVSGDALVSGADAETDDALRARLLARIQQAPQGGCAADYIEWAKEVAGVTRAWVYPHWLGVGNVGVVFVRDNDSDGPIPSDTEVATVQAYIAPKAPVTATVIAFAPTPVTFNPSIKLTPDTTDVRAAVVANLQQLLATEAVPGGTLALSQINEVISLAPGEISHDMTLPAADVTVRQEEILVWGTPTWL